MLNNWNKQKDTCVEGKTLMHRRKNVFPGEDYYRDVKGEAECVSVSQSVSQSVQSFSHV